MGMWKQSKANKDLHKLYIEIRNILIYIVIPVPETVILKATSNNKLKRNPCNSFILNT